MRLECAATAQRRFLLPLSLLHLKTFHPFLMIILFFCRSNKDLSDWNLKHVQLLIRVHKYSVVQGMAIIPSRFSLLVLDSRSLLISLNCIRTESESCYQHKAADGTLRCMKQGRNDTQTLSTSSSL